MSLSYAKNQILALESKYKESLCKILDYIPPPKEVSVYSYENEVQIEYNEFLILTDMISGYSYYSAVGIRGVLFNLYCLIDFINEALNVRKCN